MQFKGTDFHPGLNVTVRNGHGWFNKIEPGDELQLVKTGEEDQVLRTARVVTAEVVKADELPPYWLAFEHAAGARTVDGLTAAMNRAYGAGQWGPDVSVVFFWV